MTGARRIKDGWYDFFYLDLQDALIHNAAGFSRAKLKAFGAAAVTTNNAIKIGRCSTAACLSLPISFKLYSTKVVCDKSISR